MILIVTRRRKTNYVALCCLLAHFSKLFLFTAAGVFLKQTRSSAHDLPSTKQQTILAGTSGDPKWCQCVGCLIYFQLTLLPPSGQRVSDRRAHGPFFLSRFFEYIYLYQSMVVFQIDQKTKDCSKHALTDAWDPFDIPDNSTFEEQYFIGGPGDSVEAQEWSDRKPARRRESGCFRGNKFSEVVYIYSLLLAQLALKRVVLFGKRLSWW